MTKLLGGLSDRADPCAWADVNSLMVSVLLLLWQAFLCSADASRCPCRGRLDWGELVCVYSMCVSGEGGNLEYLGISLYFQGCLKTSRHQCRNTGSTAVQRTCTDAALGHWHTYQSCPKLDYSLHVCEQQYSVTMFCQQGQRAKAGFLPDCWGANLSLIKPATSFHFVFSLKKWSVNKWPYKWLKWYKIHPALISVYGIRQNMFS